MKEVEFSCRVVSPLFLGGASQLPELRPASFRGAMRWWFRAMIGGKLYDQCKNNNELISRIKQEEGDVFGNTEGAGMVSVRVRAPDTQGMVEKFQARPGSGLAYLGYGLWNEKRSYFKPGKEFTLILRFRKDEAKSQNNVLASLWLLANLGNLGSRCTRGFGSLALKCKTPKVDFPEVVSYESLLKGLIEMVPHIEVGTSKTTHGGYYPEFAILHPNWWTCFLIDDAQGNNWRNVLESMGKRLRQFREDRSSGPSKMFGSTPVYHSREYANVMKSKPVSGTSGANLPETSVFGLPHPFQVHPGPGRTVKVTIAAESRDRRRSPLIIKLHRWGKEHYISLQKFESKFIDSDIEFYAPAGGGQRKDQERVPGQMPFTEIDNFMRDKSLGRTRRIL